MPRSAKAAGPGLVTGPVLLVVALAAAAVAGAAGLPGVAVGAVVVVVAAWTEALRYRPELASATKARQVAPEVEAVLRSKRRWRTVALNVSWPSWVVVGWPLYMATVVSVLAGAAAASAPVGHVIGHVHFSIAWARALNGIGATWLVGGIARGVRQGAGGDCPGVRVTAVATIHGLVGAVLGATAGIGAYLAALRAPAGAATWPHLAAAVSFAVLGAGSGAWAGASSAALGPWRKRQAMRERWQRPWAELRVDPPPRLVDLSTVGGAEVLTFEAPPQLGARTFWEMGDKLACYESPAALFVLEAPELGASGAPVPGTRDLLRFAVAIWQSGLPDLSKPQCSPEEALLAAHCGLARAMSERKYGRPVPVSIAKVTGPEPGPVAWRSTWAWPSGPDLADIRPLRADIAASLGCEVLVDERAGAIFFGDLSSQSIGPEDKVYLGHLAEEDEWAERWSNVLKLSVNAPTPQWETERQAVLADGTVLYRLAFVTRVGVDPSEFARLEPKLATTLGAAPWVAVCGWPGEGRPGERHPQAFVVYWADAAPPAPPEALLASPGAAWVLSGALNLAFDAARLARPEVIAARSLTTPGSLPVLWEVVLRLHGGVTMSDVVTKVPVLRQVLGTSWLAVEPTSQGATLLMGASPHSKTLSLSSKHDRLRLLGSEWQMAWSAAGLKGVEGHRPRLVSVSTLAGNQAVESLDFVLPAGVDVSLVRMALPKVAAAMGYAWLEQRPSQLGPGGLRLLAAEVSPLPDMAPFDFSVPVDWSAGLALATGIEGEVVRFSPMESPHLLLAGSTGSGKSSAAQSLLWGAAASDAVVVVVDPVKAGADFSFVRPYCAAFATNVLEAASVLDLVLAEVARRRTANAAAGVGSWADLEVPPKPLVVMVDEFTSLVAPVAVSAIKAAGNFASSDELKELEAEAAARTSISMAIARIAREARSARVTLVLATQRLSAAMLDRMPGAEDLKINLARALLGRASFTERQVALRAPTEAHEMGDYTPKGRGWFEPLSAPPMLVQFWWAPQATLAAELAIRRPAPPAGSALAELIGQDATDAELVISLDDLERS